MRLRVLGIRVWDLGFRLAVVYSQLMRFRIYALGFRD